MRTRLASLVAASAATLVLVAGCGDPVEEDADADPTETPSASVGPSETVSPTPSSTASAEPTETAPPADVTTNLSTKGLDQGATPAIPYLAAADPAKPSDSWSLVRASGEPLALTVTRPFGFATLGNGLVVMVDDGDGAAVASIDGTGGEVTREDALGYRLARSVNGNIVAWLAPDHRVHFTEEGREGNFDLPEVEGAVEMGALSAYDTCFEAESDVGGCTAYVDVDEPRQAWLTSSHGIVDVAGPMLSVVDAAAGGSVIGLLSVTDEGSCGGLFKKLTKAAWQTCDHTLTSFSPSGRRVLGTDAYLDGFGQRSVAFLDAKDGTALHEFTSRGRGPTVLQTAWEDEDHVLAVVYERGRWSVVRLGVDGSAELAVGPIVGGDLDRPFVLQQD